MVQLSFEIGRTLRIIAEGEPHPVRLENNVPLKVPRNNEGFWLTKFKTLLKSNQNI